MALGTTSERTPPDQPARDRIAGDLASTVFVEAGAGSGKTSALVGRVVNLVVTGEAEMGEIAAVTFTEKAATELRDRVRQQLEKRADDAAAAGDSTVAKRCSDALDQLDGAAVGTLHSFAQRILSENPVEAGLPPRVEVLDEVSSGVAFDRRWTTWRDRLLADDKLEQTLLLLFASGVRPDALRVLASAFDANWDLVEERVTPRDGDLPPVPNVAALIEPMLDELSEASADCGHCRNPENKLFLLIREITAYVERLRQIEDPVDILEALDPYAEGTPSLNASGVGNRRDWECDIEVIRTRISAAGSALARLRADVATACAIRVAAELREFTLDAARERRRDGRLDFHDLLVLARAVVRDPQHGAAVRGRLHRRYRKLLLDEFQDTDPIQIELAVRIAAAEPESDEAGSLPWHQVPVAPGHLFVVGDPKQSIYRFRRADITTFLDAKDRFGGREGGLVELTTNFRSGEAVIRWVNEVFAQLMHEEPELLVPVKSRPDYVALHAVRAAAEAGPAVSVFGRDAHALNTRAPALRRAEARDVAAVIQRALTDHWAVFDDRASEWRPARLGDITILVPARTSLPFLEDELEQAGIPYRAESSSLVYATRAVRDLLMVLRAVADPTDHLRIVSALRTPLFACGDDDLFRFKVLHKGRWGYLGDQPDTVPADDPVASGLSYLRELHSQRYWLAPSELLDRIARDRFAFELGFAEGRPRDVWRRLRFVIDQARAWADATGGTLREYLHWVTQQTAEGARVAEAVLPETDDDAVRIMTIHAAKGLEFPITILSGMSTVPSGRYASAEVTFPATGGAPGYKLGRQVSTPEYDAWQPIDEQMGYDERIRLLYVACTRARDHLVVSLHRAEHRSAPAPRRRTNAELLTVAMSDRGLLDAIPDAIVEAGSQGPPPVPTSVAAVAPPPFDEWRAERDRALAEMGRPTTFAATALTDEGELDADDVEAPVHGLQKRPRDLDLPPWLRGRYGSAIGRAVHGVLQMVDLTTADGLDAAVAAQCEAEAVIGKDREVRRLVESALTSSSVREAAAAQHWREIYAATPVGASGRLVEGYIDLLYRSATGGLIVVDYKTSASADPTELDRRVAGYRMQGAAYALTVAATTGEPVERVTFVFLTPAGAVERHLDDLDAAVAAVRAAVERGDAIEVDEL